MSKDTLALRAARYFGWERDPRIGFRVGRAGYVMVAPPGDRTVICMYDEAYGPRGWHLNLTERQRDLLAAALNQKARPQQ